MAAMFCLSPYLGYIHVGHGTWGWNRQVGEGVNMAAMFCLSPYLGYIHVGHGTWGRNRQVGEGKHGAHIPQVLVQFGTAGIETRFSKFVQISVEATTPIDGVLQCQKPVSALKLAELELSCLEQMRVFVRDKYMKGKHLKCSTRCKPFRQKNSAKFNICAMVSLNGTLFEAKIRFGTLECAYFRFNKFTM
jgi:hypothetical protein